MKATYAYGVKMPGIGVLTKTISDKEQYAIERFAEFEPRLPWLEALGAGYKVVKLVVVELN